MKNVLVYDCNKYFSRFLKYKFSENLSFEVYRNFKKFKFENSYNMIIFVIYNEKEVFDLLKVYKCNIPLIVCSFNKDILLELKNEKNITLIDISGKKSDISFKIESVFSFLDYSC